MPIAIVIIILACGGIGIAGYVNYLLKKERNNQSQIISISSKEYYEKSLRYRDTCFYLLFNIALGVSVTYMGINLSYESGILISSLILPGAGLLIAVGFYGAKILLSYRTFKNTHTALQIPMAKDEWRTFRKKNVISLIKRIFIWIVITIILCIMAQYLKVNTIVFCAVILVVILSFSLALFFINNKYLNRYKQAG